MNKKDSIEKAIIAIKEKAIKERKFENKLFKDWQERVQMFSTRNTVGDYMRTIYEDENITVDWCYSWDYIEVFCDSDMYDEIFERIGY